MVYNKGCDRVLLGKETRKLGFMVNTSILNSATAANKLSIIQKQLLLMKRIKGRQHFAALLDFRAVLTL